MALNIKKAETERLAQELVAETGETLTEAITVALRERLEHVRRSRRQLRLHAEVTDLRRMLAEISDLDARDADEILGYDQFGLPR